MGDDMKICFFIGSMIEKGGSERVLSNLTKYFSTYTDVELLTILNSRIAYKIDDKVNVTHLDKKEILEYKSTNKFISILKYIIRYGRYRKYLKKTKPDVVVSFMPEASFLSLLTPKSKKTRRIISVRNDPSKEFKNSIYKFLSKKLYKRADGFVFQTIDAKNYFNKEIQSKSIVIPNPINEEFIEDISIINKKNNSSIVSVGRLDSQKNHFLLIDSFKEVLSKFPDATLVIYGEGSLRNKLEEYVKRNGIEDKIKLPGRVENIKEMIKEANCFVLSSNYEGMPNALMEAMALGLPVVSTDCPCGGPRFLIKNNVNGILVDTNNVKQMSEAIIKILSNKEFSKYISKNAKKIVEDLNPKKINKKWYDYVLKIYNEEI